VASSSCVFVVIDMKAMIRALCMAIYICTITADLSKFYNMGEDEYEYYDEYYEDGEYSDDSGGTINYGGGDPKVRESSDANRRSGLGEYSDRGNEFSPAGGIDFGGCETDPETGRCCITKEEQISTLKKDPVLECTHKDVEQCHYTYVTQFRPTQQELCEETFEKQCSISFSQKATNETVRKCYRPLVKVCGGQGQGGQGRGGQLDNYVDDQEEYVGRRRRRKLRFKKDTGGGGNKKCKTFFESSCTTRYVEKSPGKFVADTSCEKLPVELCGQGCQMEPGQEDCHDKVVVSVVDVPEEVCDLNPLKTCRFATKLVPHLSPTHECTVVPKQVCVLKFNTPEEVQKPLITKWCLDPSEPEPGDSYDEGNSKGSPIGPSGRASSNKNSIISARKKSKGSQNKQSHSSGSREQQSSDIHPVAETNYAAPSGKSEQPNYGSTDDTLENYDATKQAGEDYGIPETAPNSYISAEEEYGTPAEVDDEYGAPRTSEGANVKSQNVGEIYDSPNEADDSYGAPNAVEDGYGAPTSSDNDNGVTNTPGNYEAPDPSGEIYGAPSDEKSEMTNDIYSALAAATDNYGAPDIASDKYGAPDTETKTIGVDGAYSAPDAAEGGNYEAPTSAADSYIALETYGNSDKSADDEYGAPNDVSDTYGAPNTDTDDNKSEINTFHDSDDLGTYGNENQIPLPNTESYGAPVSRNQAVQENQDLQSYKSQYKIDHGFESLGTYRSGSVGSSDNLGTYGADTGLGRYLTPPYESRRSKASKGQDMKRRRNKLKNRRKSKQSKNRIRSVHPYYYV